LVGDTGEAEGEGVRDVERMTEEVDIALFCRECCGLCRDIGWSRYLFVMIMRCVPGREDRYGGCEPWQR
jgi:hypothetical protein